MLFSMAVSLYTTRVILDILGAGDFGINNLVGGIISLMGMVTSLLSAGTSRFITIALGKANIQELKNTFSSSITIHIILSSIILFIGEFIGPLIVSRLNIPVDRMGAAQYVFQLSLMSAIIGIALTPYQAAIVAHERMNVYAYISIWEVVAKLATVYLLTIINVDKLKLHSTLFFVVGLITAMAYLIYCRRHFVECKTIEFKTDKRLYREIFNYTGWNAIGSLAFTMSNQGITILLSIFGTVVNTARGIAGSVSGVVYRFVDSFQVAAKPQIVKLCAVHDFAGMNNLIMRVSKFSSYLMGLIGIPLFLEMDYVLQLWLKDVPEYTVVFARLTLIQGMIQAMDFPLGAGIHAVGKMKLPNITSSIIYMMILPISFIFIKLGASPEIVYIIVISVYPLAMLTDLLIIHKYTDLSIWRFLKEVVAKSFCFVLCTLSVTYIISCQHIDASLGRVIITTFISSLVFVSLVYLLGFTQGERLFVRKIAAPLRTTLILPTSP